MEVGVRFVEEEEARWRVFFVDVLEGVEKPFAVPFAGRKRGSETFSLSFSESEMSASVEGGGG